MDKISFKLVTPERTVLSQELVSLSCPTELGQITILPHHIPLVANLAPGELHAKTDHDDSFIFVSGGFVEVRAHNEVIVLADSAEHHYEIDAQRAEEAKTKAQKELAEKRVGSEEYAKVAVSLERSLAKINVARKHAHRKSPIASQGVLKE